jgi:hypothetical protein
MSGRNVRMSMTHKTIGGTSLRALITNIGLKKQYQLTVNQIVKKIFLLL